MGPLAVALFFVNGYGDIRALAGPGPGTGLVGPPASQYLRIESPAMVPILVKKIMLYPESSTEPDIRLEIVNRSRSPIIYLSFDLQELSNRGRKLVYELQFGSQSSIWGGRPQGKSFLRPGKKLTLSIPGKVMRPYYPGGPEYGSKAVLYFGYLVCADGSGWEGHDEGAHWSAKKCRFHR